MEPHRTFACIVGEHQFCPRATVNWRCACACHDETEDARLYAIARRVTDEELGVGTYDRMNGARLAGLADAGDHLLAADVRRRYDRMPTEGSTYGIPDPDPDDLED